MPLLGNVCNLPTYYTTVKIEYSSCVNGELLVGSDLHKIMQRILGLQYGEFIYKSVLGSRTVRFICNLMALN